ncbi:MAG: glycosyltransferase, partial [Burkholderiales bacterium]|nr:glycosyltransferase [Phycisphaerae bacterium]
MSEGLFDQPGACRFVVVAPTYNNAASLCAVLSQILALRLPLIVVNDGSTDGTANTLQEMSGDCEVLTHAINRGKAAAMRSGFDHSQQRGFTHVITIDTDGQHDVADVPRLIEAARAHPNALILGARDMWAADYPRASRVGRMWSNRFVYLESGVRLSDSQCGLRVYPISVLQLHARSTRYGFETEILTRCGWANIPVVETPIRCIYNLPGERVSHFRPWKDTAVGMCMHLRLLGRSFWPIPPRRTHAADDATTTGTIFERMLRWFNPMRAWRTIRHDPRERRRFALAVSIGVLIANLPLYGLQTLLSLLAA